MKKFVYSGPVSSVSVAEGKVVTLINGYEVELPEDHDHVKVLIEHKRLTEVPAAKEKKSTASSTSSSPNEQSPATKRGGQQGAR